MAADTRAHILEAARTCLLRSGFAGLSTRAVAEEAGVGTGHLHYHFGSKRNLVLAVLEAENQRLLARQQQMYGDEVPLWKRWEQACDFLEDDLASGYVRILQEMVAAGWSEPDIAAQVRALVVAWYDLLTRVAEEAEQELGGLGPFTAREVATLIGDAFLGAEAMLLLDADGERMPHRSALRRIGALIRAADENREG